MLARVEPSIRKESPRLSTECSALRERRLLARTISTLNISYRIKLMRTDALQILEQPQERKPVLEAFRILLRLLNKEAEERFLGGRLPWTSETVGAETSGYLDLEDST